jgi:hypothetical protein
MELDAPGRCSPCQALADDLNRQREALKKARERGAGRKGKGKGKGK